MTSHPSFTRAVFGGAAGTIAMTMMMYAVAPMMGVHMDIAAMLGSLLGHNWAAGLMMHLMMGVLLFPAVFAFALYGVLPGSPALKGTLWGAALWLMAQVVVMPMMGAGLFSSEAGGMMAAAGSLVGHLMYGSLLGAVAGQPERRVAQA